LADCREKQCSYLDPMYNRLLAVTGHPFREAVFIPFRPTAALPYFEKDACQAYAFGGRCNRCANIGVFLNNQLFSTRT